MNDIDERRRLIKKLATLAALGVTGILLADGEKPSLLPSVDADTTSGSVAFWAGGSTPSGDNSQFFWDDTNHRLGIGTATPSYPLDIMTGALVPFRVSASTAWAGFLMVGGTSPSGMNGMMIQNSTGQQYNLGVGGHTNNAVPDTLFVYDNNTSRFVLSVTSADHVGIGITSPACTLDVNAINPGSGGIVASAFRSNPGGSGSSGAYFNSIVLDNTYGTGNYKSQISFRSSNTEKWALGVDVSSVGDQNFFIWDDAHGLTRFYISDAGNVGIGTTSPNYLLDVNGTAHATNFLCGDLSFREKTCAIDKQPFKVGDIVALLVKSIDKDGIHCAPIHAYH